MDILKMVFEWMNTPAGIGVVAGVALYIINWVYSRKPLWEQYEGAIISGVKMAEKAIPDDTENKSVRRVDEALKYILEVYECVKNRKATQKEKALFVEGIARIHEGMEKDGRL